MIHVEDSYIEYFLLQANKKSLVTLTNLISYI